MDASPLHYLVESWINKSADVLDADLCIYGGTAAGVIAAVAARQVGLRVVLLHPGWVLGGMTTGGLSFTDVGNKEAIGGLARQFYRDMAAHYQVKDPAYSKTEAWNFEPHVAQRIVDGYIDVQGIPVFLRQYLEQVEGSIHNGRSYIRKVYLLGGLSVKAKVFIDATYEGDLMAKAGVSYTIGREGNAMYGETLNGFQLYPTHQFDCDVDPYCQEGSPESGLLPGLSLCLSLIGAEVGQRSGSGDRRVQAYNFRVAMSDDSENQVPFPKPEGYDPLDYELCARWLRGTHADVFRKFDRITPHKTDTNNHGAFSTDYIGGSYGWSEGDYIERERIFQAHVNYQQGLHWFMTHDQRVPEPVQREYARWGLAKDEFVETGGWPHQLYIREARRMVADYVVTEGDCRQARECSDSVGMGAYGMDSHNTQRLLVDGFVRNEGDVQQPLSRPYPISYRAILPRQGECANLFVPLAVSASHIAFGSLRMEPVFMILAESAVMAAAIAIERDIPAQSVPYGDLHRLLLGRGQVLASTAPTVGTGNIES